MPTICQSVMFISTYYTYTNICLMLKKELLYPTWGNKYSFIYMPLHSLTHCWCPPFPHQHEVHHRGCRFPQHSHCFLPAAFFAPNRMQFSSAQLFSFSTYIVLKAVFSTTETRLAHSFNNIVSDYNTQSTQKKGYLGKLILRWTPRYLADPA